MAGQISRSVHRREQADYVDTSKQDIVASEVGLRDTEVAYKQEYLNEDIYSRLVHRLPNSNDRYQLHV